MAEPDAVRVDIRGRRYKEPRRDPFDDLVERCEQKEKDKKGYASERTYIERVREIFKGRTVQGIGVQDVEDYKAHLVRLPTRNRKARSGEDVNHHLNCLRMMKRYAHLSRDH